MTAALARARTWPAPARNKYRAVKVTIDGHRFDSKRESVVYAGLALREKTGGIVQLQVHPQFEIKVNGTIIAKYTADFSFKEMSGRFRVIDVKSPATAKRRDFVLIRKLMLALYRIDVEVWP